MKKLASLMVLGVLMNLSPAPAEGDFFPLQVGHWWKYRSTFNGKTSDFTIKVMKKVGDKFLVETTSAQIIDDLYAKPAGWVEIHKSTYPQSKMTTDLKPPRKLLKNPLTVGDHWTWKGTGMMGVAIEEKNTVGADIKITVPAGQFTGRKVETAIVQGGAKVSKRYYYADGVGLVKSETNSSGVKSSTELIDYSFKRR